MAEANPYRTLPAVDELAGRLGRRLPQALRTEIARIALDQARTDIGEGKEPNVDRLSARLAAALEKSADQRVVNATGVLLHTNLGRAPWSERALERARDAAAGYSNLELDLVAGDRGRRGDYVATLLRSLTGSEDAFVVNNNASALLLVLGALAAGESVPVARGELIEIGGAYRLPDVIATSGARLIEVGTTNRTRLGDYQTALQLHRCAAILKVHPSNYRIEGFVEQANLDELARLASTNDLPLVYDIGSGLLDSQAPWAHDAMRHWLSQEPAARQSLEAGASLVLFSGDKLLGGPQAGIVAGNEELISRLRAHALSRALRPDGVTLAALAATLEAYAEGDVEEIPFWRMALTSYDVLESRAGDLAEMVGATIERGASAIGGGSAPGARIPAPTVVLDNGDQLFDCLLGSTPPILARREEGRLVIDLRSVERADDEVIAAAIMRCR